MSTREGIVIHEEQMIALRSFHRRLSHESDASPISREVISDVAYELGVLIGTIEKYCRRVPS